MKYFEYEDKEKKERARAVDAMSLLATMSELEEYNGVTAHKVYDNWYELKRQIRDVMLTEVKQPQPKEEPAAEAQDNVKRVI